MQHVLYLLFSGKNYYYFTFILTMLWSKRSYFSTDFPFLQSFSQRFGECSKHTNYNQYHCHLHVPQVFLVLQRPKYLFIFSLSAGMAKSTQWQVLFFLLINNRSGLLTRIRWFFSISKFLRILSISFSRMDSCSCIYHFSRI